MNTPVIVGDTPPRKRLTIPEVCACLKVSEAEWNTWRAAGETPLHIVGADGQLLVRAADLTRWLDARTVQPENGLSTADRAEFHRARVACGRRLAWFWLPRVARHRGGRDGER